jgi:hypothetical protein
MTDENRQNTTPTTRYSRGKVYAIICNQTGERYIGSTCAWSLADRLAGHVASHKQFLKNGKGGCSAYSIIGRANYQIVLLEDCPCVRKDQLLRRERHHIEAAVADGLLVVNRNRPVATKADLAAAAHLRHELNRATLCAIARDKYAANREAVLERGRQLYTCPCGATMKLNLKRYHCMRSADHAAWSAANPQIELPNERERLLCGCGSDIYAENRAAHEQTHRHQAWVASVSGSMAS